MAKRQIVSTAYFRGRYSRINMKRTCLVASDEEDLDGNLSNSNAPSRGWPRRSTKRVVYQTADSQSEDSDHECKTEKENVQAKVLPARRRGRPCRNIDSNSRTTFQPVMTKPFTVFIREEPGACNETANSSNTVESMTDQQPSCSNSERPIINHQVKKLKYDRQDTPICDAIMKAYKKQKLMSMQGKTDSPDLSDLSVKEIIATGKRRNKSSDLPQSKSSPEKVNNEAESGKQIQPVKQKRDSEPIICSKDESKIKSDGLLQPVVVIKRETLHPIRISKRPLTDDTDDPTWTPESSNDARLSWLTRSAKKSKQQTQINLNNEDIDEKCGVPPPTTNSPSPPTVASLLASIEGIISDFLNSEDSSPIDDEVEKCLHTTLQELIKLKNSKIQQTSPMSSSLNLNIKQEPSPQSEDCSNVNSSQLANDKKKVAQTVTLKEMIKTFVMAYLTSLSNIAALFVEAVQRERDYNSKRLEEKLDHILQCLSDNKTQMQGVHHAKKPSGRETNNSDENVSTISKIMQHDQAGLDSLLMPHMISGGCKIKTEPVDYEREQQITSNKPSRHEIYNSDNSQYVLIKEPEDYYEPLQFSSVVMPNSRKHVT